jgi:hypothetical protein
MKRSFYFLIIMMMFPLLGYGQFIQTLPNFYQPIDPSAIQEAKDSEDDKVDFGVTVGTGFTSFGGNSMMNSYVAPSLDYRVNSNLTLNFSGVVSNFNQAPFSSAPGFNPSGNGLMPLNNSNNSYSFSVGGTYKPNDRMYIRAQGQHAENTMTPFSLYPGQNNQSNDYNSFSLGMGYKLSENASIDFQFRFSDGNNPYYSPYSPYNGYNSFNSFRSYNRHPFW